VTVLQPRVARHSESACGVQSGGGTAPRDQRGHSRDLTESLWEGCLHFYGSVRSARRADTALPFAASGGWTGRTGYCPACRVPGGFLASGALGELHRRRARAGSRRRHAGRSPGAPIEFGPEKSFSNTEAAKDQVEDIVRGSGPGDFVQRPQGIIKIEQ
jgi:hypothetical protein